MDLSPDTFAVSDAVTLFVLRPEHVGTAYLGWMRDDRVQRFLESRLVAQDMDSIRDFVGRALADPDTLMLGIRLDGAHVGNVKLGPINRHHGTGEIGIMIGAPEAWGRGVGRTAIGGLCRLARDRLGLRKVTAGASAANEGSIRAFRAAGFEIEGRRRDQLRGADGIEDLVLMGRILSPASKA